MNLNIGDLFKDGCIKTTVKEIGLEIEFNLTWAQILSDDLVYEQETDYQPQRIPTWDVPMSKDIPMIYEYTIKKLVDTGFFTEYFDIYGEFDEYEYMLHHTVKGYEILWHGHFKDASHLHILMYFGSDSRKPSDGGILEVGRIKEGTSLDFGNYHILGDVNKVETIGSFNCNHGDIVVLWNANPYILHQVTKVLTDVPRYTFMTTCGYKPNINKKRRLSKYL